MIVVFTGPTLSEHEVRARADVRVLPPASQGDIYSVARSRPRAIGLIDGYFERVPSVWHKEILWAMARGVHVFGAASMGALRAAELDAFGMVGVGRIYEAYSSGELEDDDEVAVTHGPAELGYPAMSEAMVNIRATLAAAADAAVVSAETRGELLAVAKSLHYPSRTYDELLRIATAEGCSPRELAELRAWLPEGRIDRKREDAIAMLDFIERSMVDRPEVKRVRYAFQNTTQWQRLVNTLQQRPLEAEEGAETHPPDAVLDELKLLGGEEYQWVRERATVRLLALELCNYLGIEANEEAVLGMLSGIRARLGLDDGAAVDEWLKGQELTPGSFEHLIRDEVRLKHVRHMTSRRLDMFMRDQLKAEHRYADLQARSRRKQRRLAGRSLENPTTERAGMSESALWDWYFARLGAFPPEDIEGYARSLDFADLIHFRRCVLREYCFVTANPDDVEEAGTRVVGAVETRDDDGDSEAQ